MQPRAGEGNGPTSDQRPSLSPRVTGCTSPILCPDPWQVTADAGVRWRECLLKRCVAVRARQFARHNGKTDLDERWRLFVPGELFLLDTIDL